MRHIHVGRRSRQSARPEIGGIDPEGLDVRDLLVEDVRLDGRAGLLVFRQFRVFTPSKSFNTFAARAPSFLRHCA
jgi:hypothetical protein